MDTYGDMVTLLLTFFVLLFSISTIDAQKWQAFALSFAGTGGASIENIRPGTAASDLAAEDIIAQMPEEAAESDDAADDGAKDGNNQVANRFNELYEKLKKHVEDNNLGYKLNVEMYENVILIRMTDSALFDSNSAVIRKDAEPLLDDTCDIIAEYDDMIRLIRVEGHTDNVPIQSGKYMDNWELSTARASSIVRRLLDMSGITPSKLSPSGYGEYRPIADNSTKEGQARNRRGDFVIENVTED